MPLNGVTVYQARSNRWKAGIIGCLRKLRNPLKITEYDWCDKIAIRRRTIAMLNGTSFPWRHKHPSFRLVKQAARSLGENLVAIWSVETEKIALT